MIDFPTKSELFDLALSQVRPGVSIFMPTVRVGSENQQNPIRLKNLLVEAEGRIVEYGKRAPEAREMLAPAHDLLVNPDFWRNQGDGLAVFVAPSRFQVYRLPYPVEQFVAVTDRFLIRRLLPLFEGEGQFFILCLSQNGMRLLEASHFEVKEHDIASVPQSMADAMKYDQFEKSVQWHTTTSGGMPGSSGAATYHGHGDPGADEKTQILRYFQQVNEGVQGMLKNGRAPLVLAGVDYLLPIYREANTYPHLMDEGIPGNCDETGLQKLHEAAWRIVQPKFKTAEVKGRALFNELIGTGKASAQLDQVLPAASFGRVGTLYIAQGERQWGTFDPDGAALETHEKMQPGDQELLDLAAAHTLLNGGSVYVLPPDQVPGGGQLAALYRYAIESTPT